MATAAEQEQRDHKRVAISCDVRCSSGDETFSGTTEDVSIEGLLIRSERALPPGAELSVVIRLPDGTTSRVKGTVKRVDSKTNGNGGPGTAADLREGMGIEITGRDPHYILFVMSLLGNRKRQTATS
jgi:hypothetical protein